MLTLGWKELACVLVYTALVCAGHTLLRLVYVMPRPKSDRFARDPRFPAAAFVLGAVLGAVFVLSAAGDYSRWDSVVGPGLIFLTAPLCYRAARSGRAHTPFLTPVLMMTAAIATTSKTVFTMTLVFLPMGVAAMAGIGMAEVFAAQTRGEQLAFARIGGWGLRFVAESALGALVAAAAIMLLR